MINDKYFDNFEDGDEEDDIDQQEFKRISELALAKTRKFVESQIEKNQDNIAKAIGDRVIVWDGSRLTDTETEEIDYDERVHKILAESQSIVVEDRNKHLAKLTTFAGDFTKNLDLVIWNEKLNKKYRTSSEFVRIA